MNRAQMVNAVEGILDAVKESKAKGNTATVFIPALPDLTDEQKAEDEYEALGYFISHNPLEKYRYKLLELANTADIKEYDERSIVKMGGLITGLKNITTKKGQQMAVFDLEDFKGRIEVVAFPSMYKRNKEIFQKNKPVHIVGKLETQTRHINGEDFVTQKITLMKIGELEEGKKLEKVIIFPKEKDDFQEIRDIIVANPGHTVVEIVYRDAVLKTGYKILSDKKVLAELENSCLTRREYGN